MRIFFRIQIFAFCRFWVDCKSIFVVEIFSALVIEIQRFLLVDSCAILCILYFYVVFVLHLSYIPYCTFESWYVWLQVFVCDHCSFCIKLVKPRFSFQSRRSRSLHRNTFVVACLSEYCESIVSFIIYVDLIKVTFKTIGVSPHLG